MTAKAGVIEIDLQAGTARFQSDMRKATAALNTNVAQMRRSTSSLEKSFKQVNQSVDLLTKGFAGIAGVNIAAGIIKQADAFNQLTGRIKNSLDSASQFDGAFTKLVASANRSGMSIDAVAQAFVRLRPAAQNLNVSNEQLIRFNETFAKMGALAGATGEEIKNTMIQLSQGLASGTLRGDELRSVMEQMPQVARTIADSMGIPFEKFKKAAEEGKITADQVFKAIINKSQEVDDAFSKLPPSIDRSMSRMGNAIIREVGKIDQATGVTRTFAKAIDDVGKSIEDHSQKSIYFNSTLNDLAGSVTSLVGAFKNLVAMGSDLESFFSYAASGARFAAFGIDAAAINARTTAIKLKYSAKSFGPGNDKEMEKRRDAEVQAVYADAAERNRKMFEDLGLMPKKYTGPLVLNPIKNSSNNKIRTITPDTKTKKGKTDPDISRAKELIKEAQTPLERYKASIAEADRLLKKHLITYKQWQQIVDKADIETNKMVKLNPDVDDLTKSERARVDMSRLKPGQSASVEQAVDRFLNKPFEKMTKGVMDRWQNDMQQLSTADTIIDSVADASERYQKVQAELDRQLAVGNIKQDKYNKALQNAKDEAFQPIFPFINQYKKNVDDLNALVSQGTIDQKEYNEGLKRAKEEAFTPILTPMEECKKKMDAVTAAFDAGIIGQEQFTLHAKAANEALIQSILSSSQGISATVNYASGFLTGLFDTMSEGLRTGKFAFKDFAASALEDLAKLIFQFGVVIPMANALTKALGGAAGVTTGGGNAAAQAGGSIISKIIGSFIGGAFAEGGSPPMGKISLVGEKGPELFVPKTAGTIIPNSQLNAGGGVVVYQSLNFSLGVQQTVRAEIAQMMPSISKQTQKDFQAAIAKGGAAAKSVGRRT